MDVMSVELRPGDVLESSRAVPVLDRLLRDLSPRLWLKVFGVPFALIHTQLSLDELFARSGTSLRAWADTASRPLVVSVSPSRVELANVRDRSDADTLPDTIVFQAVSYDPARVIARLMPDHPVLSLELLELSLELPACALALTGLDSWRPDQDELCRTRFGDLDEGTLATAIATLRQYGFDDLSPEARQIAAGFAAGWGRTIGELIDQARLTALSST
jgi:hypothetical protein